MSQRSQHIDFSQRQAVAANSFAAAATGAQSVTAAARSR